MLLGDLGAEVIKIEAPDGGDPLRKMPPYFHKGQSVYFLAISRNKKSVTLDIRTDDGREIFYDLVKQADVVFDNFRPGILEKLKVDFEILKEKNPKIVCCSNSAYGQTGPLRDGPGFDLVVQALSGMMRYTGEPGGMPVRMGAPMGDLAGSMFATTSIVSALLAAEKTGEGRRIDLSLLDCLVAMHTYVSQYYWLGGELPEPAGSGHMSVVSYRAYRTENGFITVAVFVEKFWQALCNAIGWPELGSDERYNTAAKRLEERHEIDTLLEGAFKAKTSEEWMKHLDAEEVPAAPVLTVDQVFEHPQILARDMVIEVPDPGGEKIKMIGNPVKQTGVENHPMKAAPRLGEDTEVVLKNLLGLEEKEIERLKQQNII